MLRASTRLAETGAAAADVIAHRSKLIDAAFRDPMKGDYAELGLMVPEKAAAFSEAGLKLAQGWWAAQGDAALQFQQMGLAMLSGRAPSFAQLQAAQRRSARTGARAIAAAGDALTPIHKAATGNARRLRKGRKGRS